MITSKHYLEKPVVDVMRGGFPVFQENATVGEVLTSVRHTGLGDRIAYFYVTGENQELCGVIPTRRLLTADLETPLHNIMISDVLAVPESATVADASDLFVTHKFLALPVVDKDRRILGVIDVSILTDRVYDVAEKQQAEDLFQWIGVRISLLRTASPFDAFRYRSPWLLATLAGGFLCAIIAGVFETTLEQSLTLALFFALALGLGESVAIQSLTLTLQSFHTRRGSGSGAPGWKTAVRELATASLLGITFGAVVGLVAFFWRGTPAISISIGVSISIAIVTASLIGMTVPTLLHYLKRDPKVASGPVALAMADACTSLLYFGLAALALR